MIEVKNLPENIVAIVEQYKNKGEKYDVFPSKFFIDGTYYYCFVFAPAKEQLIIREDGVVPPLDEIKKVALIATAYNTSGITISRNGFRWVKSDTKKIYTKFSDLLSEVKEMLKQIPANAEQAIDRCIDSAKAIVHEQEKIEDAVEKAIRLMDDTNQREVTTEEDQKQLREYVKQMGWAALKQNEIQLETEQARLKMLDYLSSKKVTKPKLFFTYAKIQKMAKRMLTADSPEGRRMDDVRQEVQILANEKLEESIEAREVLNDFRNPK